MSRTLLSFATVLLAGALVAAPATAAEPKILNFPLTGQFDSLDPVRQFDEVSQQVITSVYSTLLTYSYLERPYKLEPDLLERMPEPSADKLTYTFTLRKGVHFQDDPCFPGGKGRELTSDDVLYTLKRFADANLNNKSWFGLEGAIVGLDALREATRKGGPNIDLDKLAVPGFHKIDAHRFTIKLTHVNPLFLYAFTFSSSSIVPHEAVEKYKDQFSVHPVGTGPFSLKDVERKGVLHLKRNPNFYGVYPSVGAPGDAEKGLLKDAGRRLPLVDGVDMPLIEEAQPAALKFLRGEIDWRGLDRANFSKMVVRLPNGEFKIADEYASRFNIYWAVGVDGTFFGFNMKDPLLGKNKLLRQALAHLFDTKAYLDVLFNGRGIPLNSIVPLEIPGSERDTGAVGYHYDPAEARRLLAEAGYPGGRGLPPIRVAIPATSVAAHNQFDQLKAKFAAAGVTLEPDLTDYPTFLKNLGDGNSQIFSTGWVSDYPDAQDFYQLLYSKNVAPGPNYSSFNDPAYDKAYEASQFMENGPARYAYFKTMNQIIHDEVPMVPDYNTLRFGITQKWLLNFKRNLLVPEFRFLDIDMALKKKGLQ